MPGFASRICTRCSDGDDGTSAAPLVVVAVDAILDFVGCMFAVHPASNTLAVVWVMSVQLCCSHQADFATFFVFFFPPFFFSEKSTSGDHSKCTLSCST